jgi:uncharacterized protein
MAEHAIAHIEFSAASPKEAAGFYTELFGWKHQEMPGDYWMFDTGSNLGGGYNPVGSGGLYDVKPGEVLVYVSTDDIDASLAKAEALGGKTITGKSPIPGIGWYAIFEDPTGNKVGLYTDDRAVA